MMPDCHILYPSYGTGGQDTGALIFILAAGVYLVLCLWERMLL